MVKKLLIQYQQTDHFYPIRKANHQTTINHLMRINRYIAQNTDFSRREADNLINLKRIKINNKFAQLFDQVNDKDTVYLDNNIINLKQSKKIVLFNKPPGYIVSKNGQGQRTIYDILPKDFKNLNYIGRLDKSSSGLLILTDDNELIDQLTNPKFKKIKQYEIKLNKNLSENDFHQITNYGVKLNFGISKLNLKNINNRENEFLVSMYEGKNRQIRRTFEALNYKIIKLHRIRFAQFKLNDLARGTTKIFPLK